MDESVCADIHTSSSNPEVQMMRRDTSSTESVESIEGRAFRDHQLNFYTYLSKSPNKILPCSSASLGE